MDLVKSVKVSIMDHRRAFQVASEICEVFGVSGTNSWLTTASEPGN